MFADPTKLAEAREALAVHDHHPREICPECCEDVCDPCVDALRWALAEVDRLTAEAADYVAVCPYCMARVSACDEERCCATCGTDLVVCTDDHGAEMLLLALNEAAAGDVTKWMVGCENKRAERIRLDDEITAARLIATGKVSAEHAQDVAGLVGEVATLRAERNRLTAELAEAEAENRRLRDVLGWTNQECPGKCGAVAFGALAGNVTPCPLPCPTYGYDGVPGTTHSTSCLYPLPAHKELTRE